MVHTLSSQARNSLFHVYTPELQFLSIFILEGEFQKLSVYWPKVRLCVDERPKHMGIFQNVAFSVYVWTKHEAFFVTLKHLKTFLQHFISRHHHLHSITNISLWRINLLTFLNQNQIPAADWDVTIAMSSSSSDVGTWAFSKPTFFFLSPRCPDKVLI